MKTIFKYFVLLMMIVMGNAVVASCGSDDDESTSDSKQTSKLVGKWKYSDGDDFILMLTFNSDGTGTAYEYEEGDEDRESFYYTYNDDTNVLELIWTDDDGDIDTERMVLKWINDKTFVFDNECIMKKQ